MRLGFSTVGSELLSRTCTWTLAVPGARAVLNQISARTWSSSARAWPGRKATSSGYSSGRVVTAAAVDVSVAVVVGVPRRSRVSAKTSIIRSTHSENMWHHPDADNTRARHSG